MRYLDGKKATKQVKLRDLNERVQGLVNEIQNTRQEVEDGKPPHADRRIAFEGIIIAVRNYRQTRAEEISGLALELEHERRQQEEPNERQGRHQAVSSQLCAKIMGQGETSANRANALVQAGISLRSQYATDVATLYRVVNGEAETQERVADVFSPEMPIIMYKLATFPTTPSTTILAPLPKPVPAALQGARNADRVQQWGHEIWEPNARKQGREDKGRWQEGEPSRRGNQGYGNQGPPPLRQGKDPNFSDHGSDQGGGGGGGNAGWRPDRGNHIDPQVPMMAHAIRRAIAKQW